MITTGLDLDANIEYDERTPEDTFLHSLAAERGYLHYGTNSWSTDERLNVLKDFHYLASRLVKDQAGVVVIDILDGVASINVGNGQVTVFAAADSRERVNDILELLQEYFPKSNPPDTHETQIWFWTMSIHGPKVIRRIIDVPRWDEVKSNYTERVQKALGAVIAREEWQPESGNLILWRGDPGTGKTWALRALAREWRDWCEFHYITDPEVFFGESSDYMLSVLLSGDNTPDPWDVDDGQKTDKDIPWKVLILEDSGELLAQDAKEQVGQALSRLLNTVDGLIGQGLKIIVLTTTNEELGKLHPAISRYGRCASQIEFRELSVAEANDWLKHNGREETVSHGFRVADLYAKLAGDVREEKKVGFT